MKTFKIIKKYKKKCMFKNVFKTIDCIVINRVILV